MLAVGTLVAPATGGVFGVVAAHAATSSTADREAERTERDAGATDTDTGPAGASGSSSAAADGGDEARGSASSARSRAAYYARRLASDALFVSPSLVRIAPAAELDRLRRQIRAMPFPTYVALVPRFDDEPGLRTLDDLPGLLRERMGKDGLYLVADGSGFSLDAGAYGVTTRGDVRRVSIVASDAVPRHLGPVARVSFALRHLATGAAATRSNDAERAADDARPWWIFGGAALVGFVVPLGIVAVTPGARARRRLRRAERPAREERPATVSTAPDRSASRQQAQERTAELARAVAEADAPTDIAMRAYEAASAVLSRRDAEPIDFVGADVLATIGLEALAGRTWRPCFFDPRHGEGDTATTWRRGADDATLPTCGACAKDVERGRTPASLPDRGAPYWERDTLWARTGFGAIDDRIADVVLAGGRRP